MKYVTALESHAWECGVCVCVCEIDRKKAREREIERDTESEDHKNQRWKVEIINTGCRDITRTLHIYKAECRVLRGRSHKSRPRVIRLVRRTIRVVLY